MPLVTSSKIALKKYFVILHLMQNLKSSKFKQGRKCNIGKSKCRPLVRALHTKYYNSYFLLVMMIFKMDITSTPSI